MKAQGLAKPFYNQSAHAFADLTGGNKDAVNNLIHVEILD
jgi:hypothetical protein